PSDGPTTEDHAMTMPSPSLAVAAMLALACSACGPLTLEVPAGPLVRGLARGPAATATMPERPSPSALPALLTGPRGQLPQAHGPRLEIPPGPVTWPSPVMPANASPTRTFSLERAA